MLVLMTIHDIMKIDVLRPTVLSAEFSGYQPGDVPWFKTIHSLRLFPMSPVAE